MQKSFKIQGSTLGLYDERKEGWMIFNSSNSDSGSFGRILFTVISILFYFLFPKLKNYLKLRLLRTQWSVPKLHDDQNDNMRLITLII